MAIRGSVSKRRTRSGTIRYRVRVWIDGVRTPCGTFDDEAVAYQVLAEMKARYADHPGGMTVAGCVERWIERREALDRHRAIRTQRSILDARIKSAPFANKPLKRLTQTDVRDWVESMLASAPLPGHGQTQPKQRKTAESTAKNTLTVLRGALKDAVARGQLKTNPAEGVKVPRVPRSDEPWTWLTLDEIKRVLSLPVAAEGKRPQGTISLKQHAAFAVAIYSGLREGEIWGLHWKDARFDGDRPEFVVRHSYDGPTKGGRVRRVPMLPPAREALKRWRQRSPGVGGALVFPGRGGKHHTNGYDAQWSRVARLCAFDRPVRFHDLRHTCASHLVQGSWSPPLGRRALPSRPPAARRRPAMARARVDHHHRALRPPRARRAPRPSGWSASGPHRSH